MSNKQPNLAWSNRGERSMLAHTGCEQDGEREWWSHEFLHAAAAGRPVKAGEAPEKRGVDAERR